MEDTNDTTVRLMRAALWAGVITIIYNLAEGMVSTILGMQDETIALFGFGVDSFVEVLSGIGIVHMLGRMKRGTVEQRDGFERTALKVTGTGFYLLTAGLVTGAAISIIRNDVPKTTMAGVVIASISILTMWLLYSVKRRIGKKLGSEAIIADAGCTLTCLYLSVILLVSSAAYELFGLPYIDALGSVAIAYFAFREGREAFETARTGNPACSCGSEIENHDVEHSVGARDGE